MTTDTPNPFARYVTDALLGTFQAALDAYWADPKMNTICLRCGGSGQWHGEPCDNCGAGGYYHSGTEEGAIEAAIIAALAIVGPEIRRDERERCAAVADRIHDETFEAVFRRSGNQGVSAMRGKPCLAIAAAIRALGKEG